MPGFDGTGPMGRGAMTGGARGYCYAGIESNVRPAAQDAGLGGGFPRGFRLGRGLRRGYCRGFGRQNPVYTQTIENDLTNLKAQAEAMKNSLDSIFSRIKEKEANL